ncbi:ornithine cyclodeaminase family protein [Kitasatospora sp. NPDC004531]
MTDSPWYLGPRQVARILDEDLAIASQRRAFLALDDGTGEQPAKIMHAARCDDSVSFAYLARLSADSGVAAKIGNVNPGNAALGLPTVSAVINLFDPRTGRLVAVLDGTVITTRRTAAASAVAVDALSPPDAADLAVLGSGEQALAHARAIARIRPLRTIRLWSPTPAHRERAATTLTDELALPVEAADTPERAVTGAALVAACTLSAEPVVHGARLADGCTVVSVGSFEPGRREVDDRVLDRAAAVVVDDPATAAEHAGPVVRALRTGALAASALLPLGGVLSGRLKARRSPADIVYYNSVGLGIQDAAAAWAVLDAALAAGTARRPPEAEEAR